MTAQQDKLSTPTILFHWVVAILIIGMLAFGLYLENMPRSPEKGALMGLHVSFGVTVLVLASLRILWRLKEGFPSELSPAARWQARIASATHVLLLAGTVLMPLSGIVMTVAGGGGISFFGMELIAAQRGNPDFVANEALRNLGGAMHGLGAKLMIALILLHFAGALKHQLIDRDGTLPRMLGRPVSGN